MTEYVIPTVYGLGYVVMWRRVAYAIWEDVCRVSRRGWDSLDTEDWCAGFFLACIATTVWPLILVGVFVSKGLRGADSDRLGHLLTGKPTRAEIKEKRRARLRREIEELDRELGLA